MIDGKIVGAVFVRDDPDHRKERIRHPIDGQHRIPDELANTFTLGDPTAPGFLDEGCVVAFAEKELDTDKFFGAIHVLSLTVHIVGSHYTGNKNARYPSALHLAAVDIRIVDLCSVGKAFVGIREGER